MDNSQYGRQKMPATGEPLEERNRDRSRPASRRPACPVCGGVLIEIRQKLQCARCHTICETCCEGGRG